MDLEQREGRIHRYKNHAVRRNLAATYGGQVLTTRAQDQWDELFRVARDGRAAGDCDLVPYWIFGEGPACVERRVPLLPLSRDAERFAHLRRSLAVYRMAFGQSRQEDLVAYLLDRFDETQIDRLLASIHIDLRPGARAGLALPAYAEPTALGRAAVAPVSQSASAGAPPMTSPASCHVAPAGSPTATSAATSSESHGFHCTLGSRLQSSRSLPPRTARSSRHSIRAVTSARTPTTTATQRASSSRVAARRCACASACLPPAGTASAARRTVGRRSCMSVTATCHRGDWLPIGRTSPSRS